MAFRMDTQAFNGLFCLFMLGMLAAPLAEFFQFQSVFERFFILI